MTLRSRLASVRRILVTGVAVRAVGYGIAAALSVAILAAAIDQHVALTVTTRDVLLGIASFAFIAVVGAFLWRDRNVASLGRIALWVEETQPSLEYRLVTAMETGMDSLVPLGETSEWSSSAARRTARAVGPALVASLAVVVVLLLLPSGAVARIRSPHTGDALERIAGRARGSANRLTPLVVDVAPPSYSGEKPATLDDPGDVRTLVGSAIVIRGRGDATGLVAVGGIDTLAAARDGDRWRIAFKVGPRAIAWRLRDGANERIVAVEPITDNPPTVTLTTPAHDTVLRTPKGRISLAADVSDDFGIQTANFEYIISSGEGESFKFRSGVLGAIKSAGRQSKLAASLSLDSLGLAPGDIVHLRAVARDGNTVTGPGLGTSETRSIRIARADEYDSLAVEAAAPSEAEKSVISERMLIMLAEALQKKRASLKRDAFVNESRSIAADQKRLRRSVGEIVFTRLGGEPSGEEHTDPDSPTRAKNMEELLARADSATNASSGLTDFEGGESPVVAVNKPLLEAYNAMWDATNELEVGEPGRALPHMNRALAAIQKARQAERIYLRGQPPAVVIDIAKARLQGKDKGSASKRRPLASSDSANEARVRRFVAIVEMAEHDARAAADSLQLLRIDALTDNQTFASALNDAANAIRRGRQDDATSALARARQSLAGVAVARDSIARWGIVP